MLTLEEGRFLVKLARRTIETYLRTGEIPKAPKVSAKLRRPSGVFVTLNKGGMLRGCIGHPLPTDPLIEAVVDSAVSSSTRDPRFPGVKPDELSEIEIEVSILTPPEVIKVEDPREYPKHVEISKHGLIVESGPYKGLLLPQVPVEWKWDIEEFLSQICTKAGLMPDCWLREDTRISRFSAQIFAEKKPGGQVEEHVLGEV